MKIHFISIGGSVMHQLAIALKKKGYQISGSDDEIFNPAKANLIKNDLLPAGIGWSEENINATLDAVVLGMHAKADNPELKKAIELGLPVYSFPEYIYKESRGKTRVVVGGSHGKTTTTAMIMHVLKNENMHFDYLVGAGLVGFDQSVQITDAPLIVCEGDEYPASTIEKRPKFHFLAPHIALITGIAWDHINVFPTFEKYLSQFSIFIDKIESEGFCIYNETDNVLKNLISNTTRKDIQFIPYSLPTYFIENNVTSIVIEGEKQPLQVFGAHNLLNINAAWKACELLKISASSFVKAIASFKGASKRLELLAKNDETHIYRDFAHAPSKSKATIAAVKEQFPDKKLIAVLELHTFSSLSGSFMNEYEGVMGEADLGVVFYSQHALQLKRLPALDPEAVRHGFGKKSLEVFDNRNALEEWLKGQTYKNTIVLFMSSGDFEGMNVEQFAASVTDVD